MSGERPEGVERIAWIGDLDEGALAVAGSKMARLGELRRAGFVVPDGFVVTTAGQRRFLDAAGLAGPLAEALAGVTDRDDPNLENTTRLAEVSEAVQTLILEAELPADLVAEITGAYEELAWRSREIHPPVAVRSSAVGEDGHAASFAGQLESFLGVCGPGAVLEQVRHCWASLFTPRAIAYRLRLDGSPEPGPQPDAREAAARAAGAPMAVGVGRLAMARVAGVAFSIHPVTGRDDRVVIEGSWGWGEAVVAGRVTPDHIEVGKADLRVLRYDVAHKAVASTFDPARGRVVEVALPERLALEPSLAEEEALAIAQAVVAVEEHYGYAVDVEWVLERSRRPGEPVTLVQARPETVHSKRVDVAPAWDPLAYASRYGFGRESPVS